MAPAPKRETDAILWRTESHSLVIDCPRPLLDEIHLSVLDGFRRLSHGGIEVGGVLFGRRQQNTLQLLAWRPILCEYASGPGFALSQADRAGLQQLLDTASQDPQLAVLEPLGFFVSHTRKAVQLLDRDLEILDAFFPDPWQVALVIHPRKAALSRAGFFVREQDNTVRQEASYQEFSIEQTFRVRPSAPLRSEPVEPLFPPSDPRESPAAPDPLPQPASPPARPWREWLMVLAGLLLLAVAGVALPRFRAASEGPDDSLALKLQDNNGQLRVEWNRAARQLADAEKTELQISDGGPLLVPLQREIARTGSLTYARRSEDVTIRFVVYRKDRPPTEELARFVGPPVPRPADDLLKAHKERDAFLIEAETLRQDLKREEKRTRELERTVHQLKAKLERKSKRK